MRTKLTFLVLLSALCTSTSYANDSVKPQELRPTIAENEYLYKIKDNKVLVNDKLINLVAFENGGIRVSYRNKTNKPMRPTYTFKIYTSYGMLIGAHSAGGGVFGGTKRMEPRAVSSEKIHLKRFPLDEILKHTNVEIPEDLLQMKWILISNTNSK
jgi:hypothetical protein